jgi:hypothetical protein
MKPIIAYCLLAVILLPACAPSPSPLPRYSFTSGTRVGITNALENQATHQHYSSIRIDSFIKKYDVDWDLPGFVTDQLTDALRRDGRYTVITVDRAKYSEWMTLHGDLLKLQSSENPEPELAHKLESLADQHELDVILVICSFKGPSPHKIGKSPIDLEGYGVFSRSVIPLKILPFKSAYSYAQIQISVFKSDPVALIATGRSKIKKSSIRGFELPPDAKNLPLTEVDKALPGVQKYALQTVEKTLQAANLIRTPNRIVTEPLDTPPPR